MDKNIIIKAEKIIFYIFMIILSAFLLYNAPLGILIIGSILIVGMFLLFNLLVKRQELKTTKLEKEGSFKYYFQNFLIIFIKILFFGIIFFGYSSYLFLECIFDVRNIFTGECKQFTCSYPWYYVEDDTCY